MTFMLCLCFVLQKDNKCIINKFSYFLTISDRQMYVTGSCRHDDLVMDLAATRNTIILEQEVWGSMRKGHCSWTKDICRAYSYSGNATTGSTRAFDIIVLQSYIVNRECQTFLHLGLSILHQIECWETRINSIKKCTSMFSIFGLIYFKKLMLLFYFLIELKTDLYCWGVQYLITRL